MRLIDAAEVLRTLKNSRADNPFANGYCRAVWERAHDYAISCVENEPTIEAKPVVHGKWIYGDYGKLSGTDAPLEYKCSVCSYLAVDPDDFCGGCGSRNVRKESNMKKLFISCPMKGRTEEAIKESMSRMHKIAELTFGEELEPIDSYIPDNVPENTNSALWYLGKSIQMMAEADYFIGVSEFGHAGCDIEMFVASRYGIPMEGISTRHLMPDIEPRTGSALSLDFGGLEGFGCR